MRCHWHSYLIVKEDKVQIHISKYTCLNISHVFLQTYWDRHRWQEAYNDDNQHKLQLKNKIAGQNRRLQLPATTSFLTALGILNMGESNPWKGGLPEQQPKRGTVAIMCELRWPKLRHQDISMIRKQQMAYNLRGNLNNPLGKKKKLTKTGGVFVWGGGGWLGAASLPAYCSFCSSEFWARPWCQCQCLPKRKHRLKFSWGTKTVQWNVEPCLQGLLWMLIIGDALKGVFD